MLYKAEFLKMRRHYNFIRLKTVPLSTWSKVRQPPLREDSLNPSPCRKLTQQVQLDPLWQMRKCHNSQHLGEYQVWAEWEDSQTCRLGEVFLECKEWALWTPIRCSKWWDLRWSSSCSATLLSWRWWSNKTPNYVRWLKRTPKSVPCFPTLSCFKVWWLPRTCMRPQGWCKVEAWEQAWARWVAWTCLCQEEAQTPLALHNKLNQMLIPTQRWWEVLVLAMANLVPIPTQQWWVEATAVWVGMTQQ